MDLKLKNRIFYFAYGSNLSISQMKRRCPQSKLICKAILKGYKLLFNKFSRSWNGSVADIMKSPQNNVWGLLYSITFRDLKKLDKFEGYPRAYNRKLVTIFTADNQVFSEQVWVYYISYKFKFGLPAQEYFDIIRDAAYTFSFPKYYKSMLKKVKVKKVYPPKSILEDDDLWIDIEGDQENLLYD